MAQDLESRLKTKVKELLDPLKCTLSYTSLAEFLLVEYVLALNENNGFGGYFKLESLDKIITKMPLENWGYDRVPYQSQTQSARKRIYDDSFSIYKVRLMDPKEGQNNRDRSLGYEYLLPKNEEELEILQNWYNQRKERAFTIKDHYLKEKKNKGRQTFPPLFTQTEYDVLFAPNDGGPMVFYNTLSHVFSNGGSSAIVIFAEKNGRPTQLKPEEIRQHTICDVDVKADFIRARRYGKRSPSPVCYNVFKDIFIDFLRQISDFRLDESSRIGDIGGNTWEEHEY
jgi:hypothetical protein